MHELPGHNGITDVHTGLASFPGARKIGGPGNEANTGHGNIIVLFITLD